jgi:hypothetical protein
MPTSRTFRRILATSIMAGALAVMLPLSSTACAQVMGEVDVAPPPIPTYDQPELPGDGYIWTPGYWAWSGTQYYWVDGAWVLPPYQDALWTPGWWGYGGDGYFWNAGYWGPTVGYYGGINYGFGYFGTGFYGGYWRGGRFWYNEGYNRIPRGFRNIYTQRYNGYDGRPGGPAFNSHPPIRYTGRNNNGGYGYGSRGSEGGNQSSGYHQPMNGSRGYGNTVVTGENRGGYGVRTDTGRPVYNNGYTGREGSPAGITRYGGPPTAQPQPNYGGGRTYTSPGYGGRGYSAPPQAGYSGGRSYSAPAPNYGGGRGYSAPAPSSGGGRSFSAPSGGGGGGHASAPAPSGGGGSRGGGESHGGHR